jgi:hypothetical protein
LFPAPQGGWFWASSFDDHFERAAEQAQWPHLDWKEDGRSRRLWVHTMHSLRHRFARDRIDLWEYTPAELQIVGGWQSAQVVWERYYGFSEDLLDRADRKIGRPAKELPTAS